MAHVPGGHELALFYVNRDAGATGILDQIRLPGQKSRNLNQIAHLGKSRGLVALVNVGGDG